MYDLRDDTKQQRYRLRRTTDLEKRTLEQQNSTVCKKMSGNISLSNGLSSLRKNPNFSDSRRHPAQQRIFFPMTTRTVLVVALLMMSLAPRYVFSSPVEFNLDVEESESTGSRHIVREKEATDQDLTQSDIELSAKEFLGKFGYVKPADWNYVSPRAFEEKGFNWAIIEGEETFERTAAIDGSGSELKEEEELPVVTWSFESITEGDYHRALIKYQRINGLNATGKLDNDTTSYMGMPRCGVPDRTAAAKENRTDELMRLMARTTSITTTTTTTTPINGQTDRHSTDENVAESVSIIHSVTPPSPDSSGHGLEDWGGSGDDADRKVSRKKRSQDLQVEAELEELTFQPTHEELSIDDIRARKLEFERFGGPVSEAELPDESRVSDLEGILEALRQEKMLQMNTTKRSEIINDVIRSVRPPPVAPLPRLVRRMAMEARSNRRKRSTVYMKKTTGWLMAFPNPVITWRLVEDWPTQMPFMISNEIWFTVKLAFRLWSEIIPRSFVEDNTSPITNVDILLGFGKKVHNRCLVPFYQGAFTKEYAHAWPLPQAEVHFNDEQPFVSVSWQRTGDARLAAYLRILGGPISLLKVATHEIGHALGLPHNKDKNSIMNPVYTPHQTAQVMELQEVDRKAIQQVYGPCDISFDAVFDWVRQSPDENGALRWKFNTFFFRKSWSWLYENREKRPRYGDPKYAGEGWRGVLKSDSFDPHAKIDAVVHIRDWSLPNGPIYYFTGDTYIEYDSNSDGAKHKDSKGNSYPRKIKEGFPGIPYPIDTVMYEMTEEKLYFFKDQLVYKYAWRSHKVESIQLISRAFPGWGGASPLPNNIDAAYYSYTDAAYYFFKGPYFWKRADDRERFYNKGLDIPENAVGPKRRISSKWRYICDVHETEIDMNVRAKT